MKRNLLSFFIVFSISIFVFSSCNDDDRSIINPDSVVRFETGEETIVVSEGSSDIIEIPVFANRVFEGPITVLYEIEGDESTYEMISEYGEAVIPAGQRTGVILMQPVDNDETNDPSNSILIRITGSDVGFDRPNDLAIGFSEKVVVFEDDDCYTYIPMSFTGTSSYLTSPPSPSFSANLTQIVCGGNEYRIQSAWGPNFVSFATGDPSYNGQFPYPGTLIVNLDTNEVEIQGSDSYGSGGSGTFDPETGVIQYSLTQTLFTNSFLVNVELTPN